MLIIILKAVAGAAVAVIGVDGLVVCVAVVQAGLGLLAHNEI